MTSPSSSTQGEELWHKGESRQPSSDGPYAYLIVPHPKGGTQSVQMPEWLADAIIAARAAARAARLAVEALRLLSQRGGTEIDTKAVARQALSAIDAMNQGGQHAE